MTRPTYGSLFSGVGGMDMGFDTHMDCVFQVEWDKHAQSILRRHWPDVPKWGDVQEVNGANLPPCDVLTFGSPCQDLSIAGKRAGLDGDRSSMFYEAVRIIKEMRDATNNVHPRITVWENVTGALSSNRGEDFGVVLDELAQLGAVEIEWRVLDAQHFGVPQRRRRVFVVAIFNPATAERCPDPLLPVSEGRRRDFAKGKKKGEELAGTLGGGSGSRGWSPDTDRMTFIPVDTTTTHRQLGHGHYVEDDTASALKQRDYKDATDLIATLFTEDLPAVSSGLAVRRLTPLECERLMGWNDDHTRYTDTGDEQSDSNRYKQCGNGVASPVARWIAKHITQLLTGDQH